MPAYNGTRYLITALLMGCFFVAACENDEKVVNAFNQKKISKDEVEKVESFLSQGGKIKAKLTAPLMYRYQADSPYVEFPKTLHVDFFGDTMQLESRLDARYGKYLENTNLIFLKDSIVVNNILKKDTLWCQELYWDQAKEMFYTDKPVRIRQRDRILFGDGMEASQKFDYWRIKNITGSVMVPSSGFSQ
jgi:LPS export ABC transporter protein LptC